MRLNFNCLACNINQVIKIMHLINLPRQTEEKLMREVLRYLAHTSYNTCNPEVMGEVWRIITQYTQTDNPYKAVKQYYNEAVTQLEPTIKKMIQESQTPFKTALKIAISGNLIDFAANHQFDFNTLQKQLLHIMEVPLVIDDSAELYEALHRAQTLLYLGDNCGEIVLDKCFIEYLHHIFPSLNIYYGVRGQAIINDVTWEDALMVHMDEAAKVLSNGDGSLGTVLTRVDEHFKSFFYAADVIIAKGQGNFESLSEAQRSGLFFLFMAKCDPVADLLHVPKLSIVCSALK